MTQKILNCYLEAPERLKKTNTNIADGEMLLNSKKGELSCKETSLGGCSNSVECKCLYVDCVDGCRNFVGGLSKLEKVITKQTNLVNYLDITSIVYRTEKAHLEDLILTHKKILGYQRQMEAV